MNQIIKQIEKDGKYCKTCLLPTDCLNIKIDANGVCQYCNSFESPEILGTEKLLEDIKGTLKLNTSKKYDCVVGFSGGRDSTYLLWYVVKILKLRPLAVFSDDLFIPDFMLENIQNTAKLLEVDLKIIKHDNLKRCIKHHLNAWIKRPVPETLIFINVGERIGYETLVEKEAIKEGVHLVFGGRTIMQEESYYKTDLMKINNTGGRFPWIIGYIKQVLLNPSLALNIFCLKVQYKEFMVKRWKKKLVQKHKLTIIHPFLYNYIHWREKDVENILFNEVNWILPKNSDNTNRVGCEVDTLRQFLYYRTLGYNDSNIDMSYLIRDGQLTRQDAAKKLEKSLNISEEYIRYILTKAGVDAKKFMEKLNKKYPIEYNN